MWRTVIQVLALTLVILSSIFLIKGVYGLSIKDIAELSTTKYNFSLNIAENLSLQQANTKVGFVLLILSSLLQFFNLIVPRVHFSINKRGVLLAILITVSAYIIATIISNYLFNQTLNQVKKTIPTIKLKKW